MRKMIAAMLLALGLLLSVPVANAQVPWFKCYAVSDHAYGYGWASTPPAAATIALRECAARTPVLGRLFHQVVRAGAIDGEGRNL